MSEFQSSYGLEDFIGDEELESACMEYILNSELPLLPDLKTAFKFHKKRVTITKDVFHYNWDWLVVTHMG